MSKKAFVCLYLDYLRSFSPYSFEARGKLITAMLQYAATGEEPKLSGAVKYLWPSLQAQIDRDLKRYDERCEKNRINGSKGGRPRKNQSVSKKAKEKEKKNNKEKENKNDKDKKKESERENTASAESDSLPRAFSYPCVDEVRDYCFQNDIFIDPQGFVDYYTSNGWMIGGNPMQDWQAAVRNWARKEAQYGQSELERTFKKYGIDLYPPSV